jgi:outer membrane protein TolC
MSQNKFKAPFSKYFLLANIFFVQLSSSFAQELLTLEKAISYAMQNNFSIKIAKSDAEIAAKNNTIGNAGMLPNINATLGDNFTLTNIDQAFANGQEINRNNVKGNNLNAAVNLNWTLFDGLKMFATKSKLKKLEEIGELNFKQEVQEQIAQLMSQYYEIVKSKQQLKSIRESMLLSEERVKIATNKFQLGALSKMDMLQAKIDLNTLQASLADQVKITKQLQSQLNLLMGVNENLNFELENDIPINPLNPSKVQNGVINNFAQKNIELKIEVSNYERKEIFSQFLPTLRANLGYAYGRAQSDAGFSLFNQNYGLNAGFTFVLPLFNGLNTIREMRVNTIQKNSNNLQLQLLQQQLSIQINNAILDYDNAQSKLKMELENIKLAEEFAELAMDRYRLAQATSIEIREAQKTLEDAKTRLANSKFEAKIAEITLLKVKGELIR